MISDLQQRLEYRRNLPLHLAQMTVLAGHEINVESLASLKQTALLRNAAQALSRLPAYKAELDFAELSGHRISRLVGILNNLNHSPVNVWTKYASTCGVLTLPCISAVNFAFPFDFDPNGVVSFITDDHRDRMTLDFYEDDKGRKRLQLELAGETWSKAHIDPVT